MKRLVMSCPVRHPQLGVSILLVLFLLVALGGLAAALVSVTGQQQLGMLMARETRQGWYMARTGLELGRADAVAGICGNRTLALSDWQLALSCTPRGDVREDDRRYRLIELGAVATREAGPLGTIRREARALIEVTVP
jgi:hypothetical protein